MKTTSCCSILHVVLFMLGTLKLQDVLWSEDNNPESPENQYTLNSDLNTLPSNGIKQICVWIWHHYRYHTASPYSLIVAALIGVISKTMPIN